MKQRTKKTSVSPLIFLFLLLSNTILMASNVEGLWASFDDKTGEKRAVIRVAKQDDKFQATIVKVYKKPGDIGSCFKCPGKFKDKPIVGLTFVWDLVQTGPKTWEKGQVIDPQTGQIYKMKMTLKGEQHLMVRGYLGFSLLGRTQIWRREA